MRALASLFLASLLVLFLELAAIRWFPAHVIYLTFFTNTVLLACFVGMSAGCLLAGRAGSLLPSSPLLLALAMGVAHATLALKSPLEKVVRVGDQVRAAEVVYFGTEYFAQDVSRFTVPIEVVCGFFFLAVAVSFLGLGQALGRGFARVPGRIAAYTCNIAGSLAGIALFAGASVLELPPAAWFGAGAAGVVALALLEGALARGRARLALAIGAAGMVALALPGVGVGAKRLAHGADPQAAEAETLWSPYYRIDRVGRDIFANLIGHQHMLARGAPEATAQGYALPHLLRRDAGGPPFERVLVIGAGSGNDVAHALAFGPARVDAVEIDPAIQRIGAARHPDGPYADERVRVHIDDGRSFLRRGGERYDLVVYALVDSLVLHSGQSNIRLESYLFTREAFRDVKHRLAPGGVFAMYNYFRHGWIAARLAATLREVFGEEPVAIPFPPRARIGVEDRGGYLLLLAGEGARAIREALAAAGGEARVAAAEVEAAPDIAPATDDWPFLYVRRPMLPGLALRGAAVMGGIAALVLLLARGGAGARSSLPAAGRMFFLGAGFMLVETKAVVHLALVFGSTWTVNAFVFAGILGAILIANTLVAVLRPARLLPWFALLLLALVLNALVPLDIFLGEGLLARAAAACGLAFLPVLFSGVVFAVCFARSEAPERDFAANAAGAMAGGLLEYASMLLGFRGILALAAGVYVLAGLFGLTADRRR